MIKLRYFVIQLAGVIIGPRNTYHKQNNACSDLRCHRTEDKHCTQKPLGIFVDSDMKLQQVMCARVFLSMGSSIIPFNVLMQGNISCKK